MHARQGSGHHFSCMAPPVYRRRHTPERMAASRPIAERLLRCGQPARPPRMLDLLKPDTVAFDRRRTDRIIVFEHGEHPCFFGLQQFTANVRTGLALGTRSGISGARLG